MKQLSLILLIFLLLGIPVQSQTEPEGKLFIIGGGKRPPSMVDSMLRSANLDKDDYIVILPMATGYPDEAIASVAEDISPFSTNKVVGFNFVKDAEINKGRLDSLKNAKLIYITGGDQNRFMEVVKNTPIHESIKHAYFNGATIAGTSAGAAVMSKIMITGDQNTLPDYQEFTKIWYGNAVTEEGLGLLENAIIDQHFIARSRYNRLLSVLAEFPEHIAIGIDEGTAILVHMGKAEVVGESQVIVLSNPENISHAGQKLVSFDNVKFSILTAGQSFSLMK